MAEEFIFSQNSGKQVKMKQLLLFILFLTINFAGYAQQARRNYILQYQKLAIEEMGRSGIPASIKMAQACLESRNGESELSVKSNNHFGIKCKRGWRGQKVYYDDDARDECFRKYKSIQDSYIDHSNFLMSNPRYAFLFQLAPDDYVGWAKGLKQAGYATASHYDKTLIRIIEENKLYRLDNQQAIGPMMAQGGRQQFNNGVSGRVSINPFRSHEVKSINNLDAVVAREGDTYEILAQELDMKAWEIYKFNEQPEGYKPQPNEVVYIESKRRRAARNHQTHKVVEGESMHYISQMYGIRLKPLYRRNRMDPGQQPNPGDVVYLRKRKPAN